MYVKPVSITSIASCMTSSTCAAFFHARSCTHTCRGPGVVGETPVLKPGERFEYNSACPLRTETGMMEGEYGMIQVSADSSAAAEKPEEFSVAIGQFALDTQVIVMV